MTGERRCYALAGPPGEYFPVCELHGIAIVGIVE
jgi:hypothetical protein